MSTRLSFVVLSLLKPRQGLGGCTFGIAKLTLLAIDRGQSGVALGDCLRFSSLLAKAKRLFMLLARTLKVVALELDFRQAIKRPAREYPLAAGLEDLIGLSVELFRRRQIAQRELDFGQVDQRNSFDFTRAAVDLQDLLKIRPSTTQVALGGQHKGNIDQDARNLALLADLSVQHQSFVKTLPGRGKVTRVSLQRAKIVQGDSGLLQIPDTF